MDLNPEQRKLVEAEPRGFTLIRGVAGSGKTTLALHRTLFLLRNYCSEENDRVLLVTFNRTLINYLRQILGRLKDTDYYRNIFSGDDRAVDVKTVDSLIGSYNLNKGKKLDFVTSNMKLSLLKDSIVELSKSVEHPILNQKNGLFLLNEIEWIKSCNYMELEEYQHVDRIGRQSFEEGEGPQRLPKNSPARKAIYELMLVYTRKLTGRGYDDFLERALYALNNANIKREEKYSHIIVDEAQDLTRVQWEFLKRLYAPKKHSSFTVVMDTAQSIYPHAWLVKGRSFTSIGLDMTGKSHILGKSYRNTRQIAWSAYSLIKKDEFITGDDNYVSPQTIEKQGCEPVCCIAENERKEAEYVRDKVKELLAGDYTYSDIAVIARFHNQLKYLQECFNEAGLPCYRSKKYNSTLDEKAVNLLTLHAVKGLEFKAVFIVGLNEGVMPYLPNQVEPDERRLLESNERKLLYVGMTRATEMLFLSSSGTPSSFITAFNPEHMQPVNQTKIKEIYQVTPEVYLFKDKILSPPWSNEEKVRQWFIKELINTYGYPQSSIDVEYKVNSFSQTTGSVDIVVYSGKKGSREPYLFVETKSPGSDMEAGLR